MKKYEMTTDFKEMNCGTKVYRIRALKNIEKHDVIAGQLGGFIEKESNLSQSVSDTSWVDDEAVVMGQTELVGSVLVKHNAVVEGDSKLFGHLIVNEKSHLVDTYLIGENNQITENSRLFDVQLKGDSIHISGNANLYNIRTEDTILGLRIADDVFVEGSDPLVLGGVNIHLLDNVTIEEGATIVGQRITLMNHASLLGQPTLKGIDIRLEDGASLIGDVRLGNDCKIKDTVEVRENEESFDPVLIGLRLEGDLALHVGEIYDIMQNRK